jgi:hypothetical protein
MDTSAQGRRFCRDSQSVFRSKGQANIHDAAVFGAWANRDDLDEGDG